MGLAICRGFKEIIIIHGRVGLKEESKWKHRIAILPHTLAHNVTVSHDETGDGIVHECGRSARRYITFRRGREINLCPNQDCVAYS